MNNPTTKECYNEQPLSTKSVCHNKRRGKLSADVAHTCPQRVRPSCFD